MARLHYLVKHLLQYRTVALGVVSGDGRRIGRSWVQSGFLWKDYSSHCFTVSAPFYERHHKHLAQSREGQPYQQLEAQSGGDGSVHDLEVVPDEPGLGQHSSNGRVALSRMASAPTYPDTRQEVVEKKTDEESEQNGRYHSDTGIKALVG